MKKTTIVLLTLCCIVLCLMLSACNVSDSELSSGGTDAMGTTASTYQTEPKDTLGSSGIMSANETQASTTTPTTDWDGPVSTTGAEESTRVPETTGTTVPDTTVSQTEPEITKKPENAKPAGTEENKTTAPPQTEPETTEPEAPSDCANAADCSDVAQRVLEYVNEFRASPAVRLTGLTGYAEYRSRQIVGNFAHDTADQRAAATALQYGEHVDPFLYGGSGEPYYRANAREAIAKAGYVGTVDEVALKLATLVKNSSKHWTYIGDASYGYIAVGVTYESGMWYCTITVATENTDEL